MSAKSTISSSLHSKSVGVTSASLQYTQNAIPVLQIEGGGPSGCCALRFVDCAILRFHLSVQRFFPFKYKTFFAHVCGLYYTHIAFDCVQYPQKRFHSSLPMFRVAPWKPYIPITEADDPPTKNYHNRHNTMEEDIDMDTPQISILQEDKTPPPSASSSLKPTKFKVKLLVNKKRSASQALPDDEHGEDEEDELIDDDEEGPQPAEPQPTVPPPPPAAPPKRASRSKASKTGASTSRRKPKAQPAADTTQGENITWCEVSQPDSEAKPSKAALDNTDTASVASATTTKKPTKTRTRKPPAK